MNTIWKYVSIGLIVALLGMFITSLITENKLKDRLIECQNMAPDTTYVEVHDTITFEKPVIKWKTRYQNDTVVSSDTLFLNDTVIIQQLVESLPDSFSVVSSYIDSNINATIQIEGRGVVDKTYIDSVALDYKYIKEELTPKKKCCWLRRLFGCCD